MLSCVWLLVLRLAAGAMVWLSIIAANALLLVCAGFCYGRSGLWGKAGAVGEVCKHLPIRSRNTRDTDLICVERVMLVSAPAMCWAQAIRPIALH